MGKNKGRTSAKKEGEDKAENSSAGLGSPSPTPSHVSAASSPAEVEQEKRGKRERDVSDSGEEVELAGGAPCDRRRPRVETSPPPGLPRPPPSAEEAGAIARGPCDDERDAETATASASPSPLEPLSPAPPQSEGGEAAAAAADAAAAAAYYGDVLAGRGASSSPSPAGPSRADPDPERGDGRSAATAAATDATAAAAAAYNAMMAASAAAAGAYAAVAPGAADEAAAAASERLETVHCPQALVGRLIGKGGDTIKDLQRRSGARIQIDQNFPDGAPRVVTVEGTAACVEVGVSLVRSLIGNSPAVGNGAPGKLTTFECPKALVGRVIGKGGETINELQRRSGARIQIEQRVPDGAPCIIEVQGDDAAVEDARRLVHEVMSGKRLEPQPGAYSAYHAVPAAYAAAAYPGARVPTVDFSSGLAHYGRVARMGAAPPAAVAYHHPAAYAYAQPGYVHPYAYAYAAQAPGAPAGAAYLPGSPPPAHAPPPPGWTSHQDAQGRTYWHHAASGESTWNPPPGA
jgi:far upstream element-binding protein